MKKLKNNKAITLIALIITIVVLLILAVVAINSVQEGGILAHAKSAQQTYKDAENNEATQLQNYTNYLGYYAGIENGNNLETTTTGWVQNGVGNTDITFVKGETTVNLGDTVDYNCGISQFPGKWKVIGQENGQLLLISTISVYNLSFPYSTSNEFNPNEYVNKLNNEICSKFKNPEYATIARSLNVDDIYRIEGIVPDRDINGYGDIYKYKMDGNDLLYKKNEEEEKRIVLSNYSLRPPVYLPDGTVLGGEWSQSFANKAPEMWHFKNSKLYSLLPSMCWLASPMEHANNMGGERGLFSVQRSVSAIVNERLWGTQIENRNSSSGSKDVVAVVYLKPEIQLESNGENSWHIK